MNPEREFILVADPMCSWCWGFTPVMTAIRGDYGDRVGLRLVMGGLRPGPHAAPLDATLEAHLRHTWEEVQRRTGQPFSWKLLHRNDFIYDTEPASRAVIAVRRMAPEREYDYYQAVQQAFYARNDDVTRPQTLAALAFALDLDAGAFLRAYHDDHTARATAADYAYARELGVQGFPTLLLRLGEGLHVLSQGYQTYGQLEPLLATLLSDRD